MKRRTCSSLLLSMVAACGSAQETKPAVPVPATGSVAGAARPGSITVAANTPWHELSTRLFGAARTGECYLLRGRGVERGEHVVIHHGNDEQVAVLATCRAEELVPWIEGRAPYGVGTMLPTSSSGDFLPGQPSVRVLLVGSPGHANLAGITELGVGPAGADTFFRVYAPSDDDVVVAVLPPAGGDPSAATRLPTDPFPEPPGRAAAPPDAIPLGLVDLEHAIAEIRSTWGACVGDRAVAGALTIQWLIDVDGSVAAARSLFPSRVDRDVERCIVDSFRRMKFPVRSDLPAAPVLPLRFGE
jgi:hypothetical protein